MSTANIVDKIKKYTSYLRYIFYLIVLYLASDYYLVFLSNVASREYITMLYWVQIPIIVSFIIFFTILHSTLSPKISKFLKGKAEIFNIAIAILAILVTFSVYFVFQLNTYYNTNNLLVSNNYLNTQIGNSVIKDSWRDAPFYTDAYLQNMSFIRKNFTDQTCVTLYTKSLLDMTKYNYDLENTKIPNVIYAKSIVDNLKTISEICHSEGKFLTWHERWFSRLKDFLKNVRN